MFDTLIALDTRRSSKPRWLSLPVAVAFHLAVGTVIGFAQYWQVEKLPEPPILAPFYVQLPPPPPAAHAATPTSRPARPQTSQAAANTQPTTVPDVVSPAPAQEETVVAVDPSVLPGPASPGPVVPGSLFPSSGELESVPQVVANPPAADAILTVGGAVSRPVLLAGLPPKYTEVARKAREQGAVTLEAIIDETGRVVDVQVVQGLSMGLDQEAVAAVQQWRYQPARFQGRPVKVRFFLTVNFQVA